MDHIEIAPMAADYIEDYHQALDTVAKERRYLTFLEAFPLAETRDFVLSVLEKGNPFVVALKDGRVIGWCDISRHAFASHAHCGSLGMGLLPSYRGQGIGQRLMTAVLDQARQAGFIRVELAVHADNTRAIALYEKVGFQKEGVKRRSVFIDGHFKDTVMMALMLDEG
ncbi:GNAT family N-acetyltransferase [Oryzifoliimicrobium ureilyticus]|uniref:GNAT family N-acetyltransferase n=1 Tax=Oryzifoliimicrobium ureilyticus TaxID=3113724 RepID=UPI0030766CB3